MNSDASRDSAARLHVLIVENEADIAESLAELLIMHGHLASCVASAEEALRRLRSGERPDVMIVDYRLGEGMTGLDLLQACQADPALVGLQAVLTSGFQAKDLGSVDAWRYLQKPYEPADLLAVISDLSVPGGP
jgi:CheY-like chemotaxis protein